MVFEAFGPDRLMIGSDWPVCTLSASYESAVGMVFEYIRQLPASQQAAILGGNCARFYNLPIAPFGDGSGKTAEVKLHLTS